MLAERFEVFLIDLDGVVWIGDVPLPGAVKTLGRLREAGKRLRFVTNDPRPTRHELASRLRAQGIAAEPGELVTSGWATALYLQRNALSPVHVLGSPGLAAELRSAGVELASDGVAAVLVGCDEALGYQDLRRAAELLSSGAAFVATNPDGSFPGPAGPLPATGAIVAALRAATGRRPLVIGKPERGIFAAALSGLPAGARVAMVGDRLDTDVRGAHRAGLPAILVAPSAEWGDSAPAPWVGGADAVVPSLAALFDPGVTLQYRPRPSADRVEAGVAAVVLDPRGRVLLGRRVDNGLWGLPSGHVDVGETVAEAAVREVAEETGVDVRPRGLVGVYSDPASQVFVYPDGDAVQFVTTCLRCVPARSTTPRADGLETAEAAFFHPDRLPPDLLPMHPRWLDDALGDGGPFVR